MRKFTPKFAIVAAAIAAVAVPVAAHHSTAMFEWGKAKPLENMTVVRWEWTNPHTFLYAKDADGNQWAFEGMSPNHLVRYGWSKRSLKPGDKIDMTYYPLRDGRRGGFDVTVQFADGSGLNQFGEAGSRTAAAN
ncbi:hypothetical protein GRI89_12735 [Altererythrobacter salegens]|uniref:Uncharacterized protein n=1 Tax=Croceibacterium salegens TaxID=1737568 RepID=A0A6I4SX16_9SPHN|nr:DUF6152 family protein [Croceibacterium salegens]MXO60403.1 hypothetical protein [Croceibacterium salegens]